MNSSIYIKKEKGLALFVSLVLLIAASALTVIGMQGSNMQERMTFNQHHKTISHQNAEKGVATIFQEVIDNNTGLISALQSNSASSANTLLGSAEYNVIAISSCGSSCFEVELEGVSNSGANAISTTLLKFEVVLSGGSGVPPAPAAISCLGGPCKLVGGSSAINKIDGRDHLIPEEDCGGRNCWLVPYDGGPIKPSVFLDDRNKSSISGGNPANPPFCGANSSNPSVSVCGRTKSIGSVWDATHFPNDTDGNSTAPVVDEFFDSGSVIGDLNLSSLGHNWGDLKEPAVTLFDQILTPPPPSDRAVAGVLIIDGDDYSRAGTSFFAGLIVLRGCGTISLGGNFNVYGAILIDARGCGDEYDPFSGNGTPSVRYSSSALDVANSSFTGGGKVILNSLLEVSP